MLKKIFVCVFAGMFFVAGAGANAAGVEPLKKCVEYGGSAPFWDMISDYIIYFENDSDQIPAQCMTEVDKLVEHIKKSADGKPQENIEGVIVLGMADGVGSADYNAKLAQGRANTVFEYLRIQGIPICYDHYEGYDEFGNPIYKAGRCGVTTMGDAVARAKEKLSSQYYYRAVYMFVIYKGDICDEKTIEALDALIGVLPDDSSLKQAQEICNSDKKYKMLLRSQRQQIMAAMADAIANYPKETKKVVEKLPADLSAEILADGIIAVRDSLVAGKSVWKTKTGDFNYARLASDSIAGVVLGTAGGIITSNVVKKNQIKTGFEDVMCTVGGQNVANWGDEFRVGVK